MAGYLDFIESFNRIEKYLKKYTKSDDTASFNDLLYRSSKHPMVQIYIDELHLFRKLRNIIIHQTDNFSQLIATPSDEAIERIQFIEKEISDPTNIEVFKKDVTVFSSSDSLQTVLKISGEKGITKFPIYEGDKFIGLATSRAVVKWLQKHIEQDKIELNGQLKDLLSFEKETLYKFVSCKQSIYEVWDLFTKSQQKLDVLIMTENGSKDETILAVITYDDLLKYLYTNEQYVLN
ncbi:MAG TPA: hypothetical protein DCY20_04525 [Firmicutes bacterium]|nr:hypothetical protein [Bacillota bacterium]